MAKQPNKPKNGQRTKPGPDEERLKLDMDWNDAAKRILSKPKQKDGRPDADKNKGDQD